LAASLLKELYSSPNGDRWALSQDPDGKLVVTHHPNKASGGRPSEVGVDVFLAHGGQGPEYQALLDALPFVTVVEESHPSTDLTPEEKAMVSRALGQAVAQWWSRLPQDIQHNLFEAAVSSEGESIRQLLAVFLHGRHDRTVDALQRRAIPEPDSPGG
jgi:hypothetical protein